MNYIKEYFENKRLKEQIKELTKIQEKEKKN